MIEPINKVTCDWCGKYELTSTNTISKEFFLVSIKHAPAQKELSCDIDSPDVERVLLCTACRNALESVKNLRKKERRENKSSQFPSCNWAPLAPQNGDRVCA